MGHAPSERAQALEGLRPVQPGLQRPGLRDVGQEGHACDHLARCVSLGRGRDLEPALRPIEASCPQEVALRLALPADGLARQQCRPVLGEDEVGEVVAEKLGGVLAAEELGQLLVAFEDGAARADPKETLLTGRKETPESLLAGPQRLLGAHALADVPGVGHHAAQDRILQLVDRDRLHPGPAAGLGPVAVADGGGGPGSRQHRGEGLLDRLPVLRVDEREGVDPSQLLERVPADRLSGSRVEDQAPLCVEEREDVPGMIRQRAEDLLPLKVAVLAPRLAHGGIVAERPGMRTIGGDPAACSPGSPRDEGAGPGDVPGGAGAARPDGGLGSVTRARPARAPTRPGRLRSGSGAGSRPTGPGPGPGRGWPGRPGSAPAARRSRCSVPAVTTGCLGRNSKSQSEAREVVSRARTLDRSAATSVKMSLAAVTVSPAVVATPSRKQASHPPNRRRSGPR